MDWKGRCQYFHDTQLRRDRGIAVGGVLALLSLGGGYDFLVAQFATNPSEWWRARDILGLLPPYGWAIVVLTLVCIALFEGGFRAQRSNAKTDPIVQLQRDKQQLTEYAATALKYARDDSVSNSGIERFLNDAGQKVTELLGEYEGIIFREAFEGSLNPAVHEAGNRHKQALRIAAGCLNGYVNRLTTQGLTEVQLA